MNRIKSYTKGISAFLLVLFCMPVGHALMVINDHMIADKFTGAFIIGLVGSVLTLIGIYLNHKAIGAGESMLVLDIRIGLFSR